MPIHDTENITCVAPVVEPVCAEEKTAYEERFIYNPSCLVNAGRPAYFKASWESADYPASRVSWPSDNAQMDAQHRKAAVQNVLNIVSPSPGGPCCGIIGT